MRVLELIGLGTTVIVMGFVILQIATFMRVSSQSLHSSGDIITMGDLGVYEDPGCTLSATELLWGEMEPGQSKNVTLYLKNEGRLAATLSVVTENWQPQNASQYIALSWNLEGSRINSQEVKAAIFQLTISSEIQGIYTFSFDIVIYTDL